MKTTLRLLRLSSAVLLLAAGCGSNTSPRAIPTVVLNAGSSSAGSAITASGVVVPARHAELSFPLTGVVRMVPVQVGARVTAGQPLIQLDTAVLEAEAKIADADLQAAQIGYTYLARTGTDQEHLDSALADVARAQALLDVKRATVTQATLLAPFEGTVASIDISPAETVVPGQVVLTLGDLRKFQIETTDLSERDIPKIDIGQTVTVFIEALNQDVTGRVSAISPLADTLGGDVVYRTTIDLDTLPPGLRSGMSVEVQFENNQ